MEMDLDLYRREVLLIRHIQTTALLHLVRHAFNCGMEVVIENNQVQAGQL
jgi:hypothetical protein